MNGQWLGTRKIRTNWATRKGPTNETVTTSARSRGTRLRSVNRQSHPSDLDSHNPQYGQESTASRLDFNEVWNRTGETNSTVYFGNCAEVSEDLVRSYFEPYGPIQEVRLFREKGYAFIR